MYSRNAVAALLVLDVSNQQSYEHMEMWLTVIQANCPATCRIYCVANKMDLRCNIPLAEFEKWCQERSFPLFKTSAKEFDTVAPLFANVAEDILRSGRPVVLPNSPQEADKTQSGCC
jgi:GTPase SAR1 family protein